MAPKPPQSSVRIRALHQRKTSETSDVLHPGNGTPWEDRGSTGTMPAYFATVKMALRSPRQLWFEIRRPDSLGDARPFAVLCAAIGGLAAGINAVALGIYSKTLLEPGGIARAVVIALVGFGAGFGAYLLGPGIFHRMLGDANRKRIPASLMRTLFAYSLAPVVVAVIPLAGPILAALWTLVLWFTAARRRLYVRPGEASVAVAVTAVGLMLILGGGGFLITWLLGRVVSNFTGV